MLAAKYFPLFLFISQVAAAQVIVGGPVAVHVSSKNATIVWVERNETVELAGADSQPARTAAAFTARTVGFTGLKAGQEYHYQIPGHPETSGSFRTARPRGARFDFVVYGDTRTRPEMHRRVVAAILRDGIPDFVMHTGDLVANGLESSRWPVFFEIANPLLRKAAFFPALGNHERNSPYFHQFFDVRTPYYSFDWGSAHFVVLNSDYGNAAASKEKIKQFWAEQLRWLEDELASHQGRDLLFVMMHHPPFTAVKKRQKKEKPVDAMVPLFEKYKVTAVFNGHDHNYQHHLRNGVHYIVTGGGGAPLYPVDAPLKGITLKAESTENYVRVAVDGGRAVVRAIGLDGREIDRIELAGGR